MNYGRYSIVGLIFLLAVGGYAGAEVYDHGGTLVNIESWVGSGANEAVCVVDFSDGDDDSFAFGYRWDDGQTVDRPPSTYASTYGTTVGAERGEAMLLVLDAETDLDVIYSYHDLYGFAVEGFTYDDGLELHTIVSDGWVTTFPGYWYSSDGLTWDDSDVGATTRELADGGWDGWTQEYTANGWLPVNTPVTPVPEPATIVGDMDGSGGAIEPNGNDINPFVMALVDRPGYELAFPGLDADARGDCAQDDGLLNGNDIDPFVQMLVGSSHAVPEPTTVAFFALGGLSLMRRRLRRTMR